MPITAYSGSWGKPQLFHLLRRTLFGVKKSDLAHFNGKTLSEVVDELLADTPLPAPPLVDYDEVRATGTPDMTPPNWVYEPLAVGETWVNDKRFYNRIYNGNRQSSLRKWWFGLMINQDRNIREKMVLFWHNHIPTDIGGTVTDATHSFRYNAVLRQFALGNLKDLIRQMTIEPAMLVYLNGRNNTKRGPNENYARELQELFTIGKDLPSAYTEDDVKAAAKVLTGWELSPNDRTTGLNDYSYKFNVNNHDTTNKTFSAFYNGRVINGNTDGLAELNELLDMIFVNQEVAKFIVRKLYRFFVYYKIDQNIENQIITPLAETYRNNNYNIKPVLRELLTSQHFYDTEIARACMIKNPVDHVVGIVRSFDLTLTGATLKDTYRNWGVFDGETNNQQMRPGNPPNVAGWIAYYQTPNFHELWINAETLRRKKEYIDRLFFNGLNGVKVDVLAFTRTLSSPSSPNALIEEVVELLHIAPLDTAIFTNMKNILLSGQTQDSYWTSAWDAYIAAPTNMTQVNIVQTRLRTLYQALTNMAESLLI